MIHFKRRVVSYMIPLKTHMAVLFVSMKVSTLYTGSCAKQTAERAAENVKSERSTHSGAVVRCHAACACRLRFRVQGLGFEVWG